MAYKLELLSVMIFIVSLVLSIQFHHLDNFVIMYSLITLIVICLLRFNNETRTAKLLSILFSLNLIIYFEITNIITIVAYFLTVFTSENDKNIGDISVGKDRIFNQLLKFSPNPIFIKNSDFTYSLVNHAYLKVHNFSSKARKEAQQMIQPLLEHLDEAGVDFVSEVFDGDPPHSPRGCIAQAWSVSELLRAYVLIHS